MLFKSGKHIMWVVCGVNCNFPPHIRVDTDLIFTWGVYPMGHKGKLVKAYYKVYEKQFQSLYDDGVYLYDAHRQAWETIYVVNLFTWADYPACCNVMICDEAFTTWIPWLLEVLMGGHLR